VKNIGIDIDIADILGSEISVNIDIGKYDIDPALRRTAQPISAQCAFPRFWQTLRV